MDELKTKSPVVDKLLWTEKFVLDKDTFETLHDSNNPNSDPAFWNTKEVEFVLACKNLSDFLNKNQNRSKLQTYLTNTWNSDAKSKIREIKSNLDGYCKDLKETITTNSADIAFLYIDPQTNDLFICKSPKVIQKNQNWLPQKIIKKWDFHQIDNQSTITTDGKLVTQSWNKIQYTSLVYIPDMSQAQEIIVENSILKNDIWTMLKNTTSDIAWITWQFVGILSNTSNFAQNLMSTYNMLTILPQQNNINQQIINLQTENSQINLQLSTLEGKKDNLEAEKSLLAITDDPNADSSQIAHLNNQIQNLNNQIYKLEDQKIQNEQLIAQLKAKLDSMRSSRSMSQIWPSSSMGWNMGW